MAWYDRLLGRTPDIEEKLNPAQYVISRNEGLTVDSREIVTNYRNAYEQLEIVNRAVNMIVDDVADIPYTLGNQIPGTNNIVKNIRRSQEQNEIFSRGKENFSPRLQEFGEPASVTYGPSGMVNSYDAFVNLPSGVNVSGSYQPQTDDYNIMARIRKEF